MSTLTQKLTRQEKDWILYDVGNSAFTLLATSILPLIFNGMAEAAKIAPSDYLAYWGYTITICTLLVAVIGPILGAAADSRGGKKRLFVITLVIGVAACILMGFGSHWLSFLLIFAVARVAYSSTLVIYDSMLTDVSPPERMDEVSSKGYAWGYIGSVVPFIVSLVLMLMGDKMGLSSQTAIILVMVINGLWWLVFTLPMLKSYRQTHYLSEKQASLAEIFRRLKDTLTEIRQDKKVLFFLLAFFFYIDGVYTIIDMAVAFGGAIGLESDGLLLALLLTQFVAFPAALFFGRLSKRIENAKLIRLCIVAYAAITAFAIQLDQQWEFWVLAVAVGCFQGAIQALSRSYFAQIIPPEKSGKYFGIYDICGKGASILGTFLVSFISQITDRPNLAISVLLFMFLFGYLAFQKTNRLVAEEA